MLFELKRADGVSGADNKDILQASVGESAQVKVLGNDVTVECRNLDEVTTKKDLEGALRNRFDLGNASLEMKMKPAFNRTQTAYVKMPMKQHIANNKEMFPVLGVQPSVADQADLTYICVVVKRIIWHVVAPSRQGAFCAELRCSGRSVVIAELTAALTDLRTQLTEEFESRLTAASERIKGSVLGSLSHLINVRHPPHASPSTMTRTALATNTSASATHTPPVDSRRFAGLMLIDRSPPSDVMSPTPALLTATARINLHLPPHYCYHQNRLNSGCIFPGADHWLRYRKCRHLLRSNSVWMMSLLGSWYRPMGISAL
uniref:Uncharacterized protein n=1 Tax=Anopheles funestus TaxID=62324 RepID=A0A4Y0BGE3_ANOFN